MKAMKTKMLIFVFLLGITDLFAQTLYVPGTIVKGKNASYYCSFENKLVVKVYNVNNVDTTTTMYYDDGTVVPYYVGSNLVITGSLLRNLNVISNVLPCLSVTTFNISKYEILLFSIFLSSCVNVS